MAALHMAETRTSSVDSLVSKVFQLPNVLGDALVSLWRDQQLCDVALISSEGEHHPAHRLVLAAGAGYFRALWAGGGAAMWEAGRAALAFPQYSSEQLGALLRVLYEQRVQVDPSCVPWLLDLGCYFQVGPLVEACCQYLRELLSMDTSLDVLLLAHHHHLQDLQQEALVFVCRRLPALLREEGGRARLAALPLALLLELLGHEELLVDSELDVLTLIGTWVGAHPSARSAALPRLLGLLAVGELPPGCLLEDHLPLSACGAHPSGASALAALQHHMSGTQPESAGVMAGVDTLPLMDQQAAAGAALPGLCSLQPLGSSSSSSWESGLAQRMQGGPTCGQPGEARAPCTPTAREAACCSSSNTAMVTVESAGNLLPHSSAGLPCRYSGTSPGDQAAITWEGCAASLGSSWGSGCADQGGWLASWPAASSRRRAASARRLMVVGGHDLSWRTCGSAEVLEPAAEAWAPGVVLPSHMCYGFASAARLGRAVYVVEGAMFSSRVARYEPASDTWSDGVALPTPRMHAAVAATSGLLFVLGGRNQVNRVLPHLEAFSPEAGTWSHCAHLSTPRYALGAATLGGRLYAVAGSSAKASLGCVEVYDPEKDTWSQCNGLLAQPRKYSSVVSWNGRLVVLGGVTEPRHRLASCEALDPREGRWVALPNMMAARSSCGASILGDSLWVVGGNAGDAALHASCEVLDAAAGSWRPGPCLGVGRSGLAVAGI